MTGLLLKLLGAEMDDAVHIATTSLAFRGGIGLGWFVLLLLGLGAVFFWLYRNSPPNLSLRRKSLLAGLRILFIGLILLLLMPSIQLCICGRLNNGPRRCRNLVRMNCRRHDGPIGLRCLRIFVRILRTIR